MNNERYSSVVFLHLSDIHFCKKSTSGYYDLDQDLRSQLEKDAVQKVKEIGNVNNILITGDIAFAGDANEYLKAKEWLGHLAKLVNSSFNNILTVPGNHDVDRKVYDNDFLLRKALDSIDENENDDQLNIWLSSIYESNKSKELLYESIKNYNDFAKDFDCDLNHERQYWEREFLLKNDIKIYLRGLNSTLGSTKRDSRTKNLFLGLKQIQLPTDDRTINFTLCHHPPDWLRDLDQVELYLSNRANVQLFGHKHKHNLREIENQVRVTSGAVHPDRKEDGWLPRYNFIKVTTESDDSVKITVYPRIWHETHFIDDKNGTKGKGFYEKIFDFNIVTEEVSSAKKVDHYSNNNIPKNRERQSKQINNDNSNDPDIVKTNVSNDPISSSSTDEVVNEDVENVSRIIPNFKQFLTLLKEKCAATIVKDFDRDTIQEPNFILFERSRQQILTIASNFSKIDTRRLQKTTESINDSKLLTDEQIQAIGFNLDQIHPMFKDPQNVVYRIFFDAELLVQAIWFPNSLMALPLYDSENPKEKILAPIKAILETLIEFHGQDKIIFANVLLQTRRKKWGNPILEKLLKESPLITRFAPTPSNSLHIGSARTALINLLLSARVSDTSKMILRIDDTDPDRHQSNTVVEEVKKDLTWLGIKWDTAFHQDSIESNENYQLILEILTEAGFVEEIENRNDNDKAKATFILKPIHSPNYYRIFFDWREGAIVSHQEWSKKYDTKNEGNIKDVIKLFRRDKNGRKGNAYYSYAGLIDDIRGLLEGDPHLTYVVRDHRQESLLTRRQSHILQAIEISRQKLKLNFKIADHFNKLKINPRNYIRLPIYFHVDLMADASNEPFSKRRMGDNNKHQIKNLRETQKILPESIIAYLLTTIIKPEINQSLRNHLYEIAKTICHLGISQTLRYFSTKINIYEIVKKRDNIIYDYEQLLFIDGVITRKLPLSKLSEKIREEFRIERFDAREELIINNISRHSNYLANWSQVLALYKKTTTKVKINTETLELLQGISSYSKNHKEFIKEILNELDKLKEEIDKVDENGSSTHLRKWIQLQMDLRLILTGGVGPRIRQIFTILGDEETGIRIRQAIGEQV